MSDTTPRERRQQRTRDAILKAAVDMIREEGADKLSLRAIARKIDYSPAGLYEYFGSKEEIIAAVCAQGNSYLMRYLKEVSSDLPTDAYLIELGLAYVRFARENPEIFTLMFSNLSGPAEMIAADEVRDDDSFHVLVRAVQVAVEAGHITPEPDETIMSISYGLWALVHGMAILQVTYLSELAFDYKRADHFTLKTYIKGLLQP